MLLSTGFFAPHLPCRVGTEEVVTVVCLCVVMTTLIEFLDFFILFYKVCLLNFVKINSLLKYMAL